MVATWRKCDKRDGYTFYKRSMSGTTIYNVTKNGKPPSAGAGGYPDKHSLMRLKGIK